MGDVRDTRIDRTVINNMFIALKMNTRTTEDTRRVIGTKILSMTEYRYDTIESIDVEDGTIFYLIERGGTTPRKLWETTPNDLESLTDTIDEYFDADISPEFRWVIMDRDIKISYRQVNL